jgi:putrescine transport system ATP-binding protein
MDRASQTQPATEAPAGSGAVLRIAGVTKRFGGVTAVDDLSLDIDAGEFFALLGPSGCGKTTLLRMLAGLESPDSGQILLDGADIAGLPPHLRPVNMMFQNYALFPHLDVGDNIAFGLRRMKLPAAEIDARVAEMLALTQLDGLERRRPDQLSGGQRQRVALARALARRPRLLLLDEPLAALDRKLRESTQAELLALQRRLGMTFIVVTHDQHEAMALADRIAVMREGRLAQVSSPRGLYESPNSRWVAGFVGDANFIEGLVVSSHGGALSLRTQEAGLLVVSSTREAVIGMTVCVAIRPEKIRLSADAASGDLANALRGTIEDGVYRGGASLYRVKLTSGAVIHASAPNVVRAAAPIFAVGQRVSLSISPDACVVLEQ